MAQKEINVRRYKQMYTPLNHKDVAYSFFLFIQTFIRIESIKNKAKVETVIITSKKSFATTEQSSSCILTSKYTILHTLFSIIFLILFILQIYHNNSAKGKMNK